MIYRFRWLAAAALASIAQPALAQVATADGVSRIVDQFSVTKNNDLLFGTVILPSDGDNDVVISASDGSRELEGTGNAGLLGGGTSRAVFTVNGDGGQGFDINVPPSLILTRASGTETITVALTPSDVAGEIGGSAGTPGTATFGVGGTLPISSTTIAGLYEGLLLVSVDNN